MKKTTYIQQMPQEVKRDIMKDLKSIGMTNEDFRIALYGRLCDLEDTIDISKYL